jgi:hypothetical protein
VIYRCKSSRGVPCTTLSIHLCHAKACRRLQLVIPTGADPISYIAVAHEGTYAAFRKERRTRFANATKPYRKSGGAQGRDLQFHFRVSANLSWANRHRMQNFLPGFVLVH